MLDRFVQGAKPTEEHFAYIIPYTYSKNMSERDTQANWGGNLRCKGGVREMGEPIC